jgi:hypothetical protein
MKRSISTWRVPSQLFISNPAGININQLEKSIPEETALHLCPRQDNLGLWYTIFSMKNYPLVYQKLILTTESSNCLK